MSDDSIRTVHGDDNADWKSCKIGSRVINIEKLSKKVGKPVVIRQETQAGAGPKKIIKSRCGLCKLWFEKASVNCGVPNHRIIALESSWNLDRDLKRYQSPSFLYTICRVCAFCAQFFESTSEEQQENSAKNNQEDFIQYDSKTEPVLKTEIKRTNIAILKKTYQSSIVDNLNANNAITEPYEKGSRTRLEVDPWWEIDFGSNPIGFENPFLEELKTDCIAYKEFIILKSKSPEMEDMNWELPSDYRVRAVRIQARQGDQIDDDMLYDMNMNNSNNGGNSNNRESFATVPLYILKKKSRFPSPSRNRNPRLSIPQSVVSKTSRASQLSVVTISDQIESQYGHMQAWRGRATQAANFFDNNVTASITHPTAPAIHQPVLHHIHSMQQLIHMHTQQYTTSTSHNEIPTATNHKILLALRDLIFNAAIDVEGTKGLIPHSIRAQ
eukprot:gene12937-27296_t